MKVPPLKQILKSFVGRQALKIAISLVLLGVVYAMVDLGAVLATLSRISVLGALGLLAGYTVGQLMSAVKWGILVEGAGIHRSQAVFTRAYFMGMFANSFGLGTVGGDLARSLLLYPAPGQRAAALASVVADRLHGLACLLLVGAVGVLIANPPVMGSFGQPLAIAGLLLLAACWWAGPKVLVRLFARSERYAAAARMAASAFPAYGRPLLLATAISVAYHCLQVVLHLLIASDLGIEISLLYLFATVPFVNIASSLPLSMNGLGIREAMYVLLFVPYGINQEAAVAFGAVWIVVVTIVSAVGGLVFGTRVENAAAEDPGAEGEFYGADRPEAAAGSRDRNAA